MSKYRRGICPECKVKEGDSSRKALYQCKSCERWFCAEHFEPRLVRIPDYDVFAKYPEVRVTFEKESRRENGHPDFAYSLKRFRELEMEEKLHSKLIKDALNRSKAYRKKTPRKEIAVEKHTQLQAITEPLDNCPKCGSRHLTITFGEKSEIYGCLDCLFEWKHPCIKKRKKKRFGIF